MAKKLVGKQKKLDRNKNGKIDSGDFEIINEERKMKKMKKKPKGMRNGGKAMKPKGMRNGGKAMKPKGMRNGGKAMKPKGMRNGGKAMKPKGMSMGGKVIKGPYS